jgi:peptide deformylase
MNILTYPNRTLTKKCAEVDGDDDGVFPLMDRMLETMYAANGGGLAAPQVGVLKRVVVMDPQLEPRIVYRLINPRIVWASEAMVESEEGCLSIPLLRDTVVRHESVSVEYLNEFFRKCYIENAEGYFAMCLQHELDHLDGKLYIDRLSRLKRARAIRRFKKLLTEEEESKRETDG